MTLGRRYHRTATRWSTPAACRRRWTRYYPTGKAAARPPRPAQLVAVPLPGVHRDGPEAPAGRPGLPPDRHPRRELPERDEGRRRQPDPARPPAPAGPARPEPRELPAVRHPERRAEALARRSRPEGHPPRLQPPAGAVAGRCNAAVTPADERRRILPSTRGCAAVPTSLERASRAPLDLAFDRLRRDASDGACAFDDLAAPAGRRSRVSRRQFLARAGGSADPGETSPQRAADRR